jgi:hypothetical protein
MVSSTLRVEPQSWPATQCLYISHGLAYSHVQTNFPEVLLVLIDPE